jgi:hypothetical protein
MEIIEMNGYGKECEVQQRRSITPATGGYAPSPVIVIYRGAGPYLIEGPHSRKVYFFSPRRAEQLVDAADVYALVDSGLFESKRV